MDTQGLSTLIGIAAGVVTVLTALVLTLRHFARTREMFAELKSEVSELNRQNTSLQSTISLSKTESTTQVFDQLRALSTEAAAAIRATYHSVSIAEPLENPTHLKFIFSTDADADNILGMTFPISQGLSGAVFQRQVSERSARLCSEPRHFAKIDKAAKTRSGEVPALAIPLPLKDQGRCRGIAMFFRAPGQDFSDTDISVVERWAPRIGRLLAQLEIESHQDIPSVARGNRRTATIVFCDIIGFSEVVEPLRLETNVALLNEYYKTLVPIIESNSGELREYLGDGIYASFSTTDPAQNAQSAVTAAVQISQKYGALLNRWINFDHPISNRNSHAIGIATGDVHCGLVGPSSCRREKLVGGPVNLAAYLCEESKRSSGGITICEKTALLLSGKPWQITPIKTSLKPAHRLVITG